MARSRHWPRSSRASAGMLTRVCGNDPHAGKIGQPAGCARSNVTVTAQRAMIWPRTLIVKIRFSLEEHHRCSPETGSRHAASRAEYLLYLVGERGWPPAFAATRAPVEFAEVRSRCGIGGA